MKKMEGLSKTEVANISHQIADAFYDYKYNKEDQGLIKYISTRENMFTYIHAIMILLPKKKYLSFWTQTIKTRDCGTSILG
ncbi:hypothetical protein [Pseudoramibacter faecis]|uniref:hypothetical protein n=1 Tax=Pseudoramibacter faecis TaxID=3108534 RepID=UPI002E793A7C|nr:hypothetical protein [Pseudoramibacter sp. HA2172]